MRRAFVGLLAAAILGLTGCGGGGNSGDAADEAPKSFVAALNARLTDKGTVPFDAALELYTTAVGPLPGVDVPRFEGRGDPDASLAIHALVAHWDRLTAAQRRAVAEELFGKGGQDLRDAIPALNADGTPAGPTTTGPVGGTADRLDDVVIRAVIDDVNRRIKDRLGRALGIPVYFLHGSTPGAVAEAIPVARAPELMTDRGGFLNWVYTAELGRPAGCLIRIDESSFMRLASFEGILTHEVFHCFQAALGTGRQLYNMPLWIREGQALYAGFDLSTARFTSLWLPWFMHPETALFDRSYDNIGFYAMLAQRGVDPWRIFDPMVRAVNTRGSQAAYDLVVTAEPESFPMHMATALTRRNIYGLQWDVTDDRIPMIRQHRTIPVGAGATSEFRISAGKYGTVGLELVLAGDLVDIETNAVLGALAFEGSATTTFVNEPVSRGVCLRPGGCVCPDGSSPSGGPYVAGASRAALSLANGGNRPTLSVELRSRTLEEACRGVTTTTRRGETDACLVGTWQVTSQVFEEPIESLIGEYSLEGGIGGRRLLLLPDGSYEASDNGSDPVTINTDVSNDDGNRIIQALAQVVAKASGRWSSDNRAVTFALESLEGTAAVVVAAAGVETTTRIPLSEADFRDAYGFAGTARYECGSDALTLRFRNRIDGRTVPTVVYELERV